MKLPFFIRKRKLIKNAITLLKAGGDDCGCHGFKCTDCALNGMDCTYFKGIQRFSEIAPHRVQLLKEFLKEHAKEEDLLELLL